jgi:hypothetical protein
MYFLERYSTLDQPVNQDGKRYASGIAKKSLKEHQLALVENLKKS